MAVIPSLSLNSLIGLAESEANSAGSLADSMLNKTMSQAKQAADIDEKDKLKIEDLRKANEGTDAATEAMQKATLETALSTSLETSGPLQKIYAGLGMDKGGISLNFGSKV